MDIKLKKLSEKQEKRLLWAAGMLAPVALALALDALNYKHGNEKVHSFTQSKFNGYPMRHLVRQYLPLLQESGQL